MEKQAFMEDATKNLYPPLILDHYRNPRNYGTLAEYSIAGNSRNPSCGDTISLQGLVHNGVLEVVRFEGSGCMLSQAAASIILEHVTGMAVGEILKLTPAQMYPIVGITVGPTRARCIDLVLEVLQKALGSKE